MDPDLLLSEIVQFCEQIGMAPSTFGRMAVNDGKLATRLSYRGRVTDATLQRIRRFMDEYPARPAKSDLHAAPTTGDDARKARPRQLVGPFSYREPELKTELMTQGSASTSTNGISGGHRHDR